MKNHTPPHTLAPPLQPPGFASLLRWMVFSLLAVFAPVLQAQPIDPAVANPSSASISFTTVDLGGEVTVPGDTPATIRGVVYAVTTSNSDPDMGEEGVLNVSQSFDGSTGTFSLPVSELTPGTGYSFKAFVSNDDGLTYFHSVSGTFTTLAKPTVSTPTAEAITATTASLGGTVDSQGGGALSERGVVYSVKAVKDTPDLTDTKLVEGATTVDSFYVDAEGLLAGTEYAYRAYATNGGGTSYSSVGNFTTTTAKPTVSSPNKSSVDKTSVTLSGVVDHNGGLSVTERGFVYSITNTNPVISGPATTKVIDDTTGSGAFDKGITGLLPGETYYFKAYATNSKGTTYTSVATFLTLSDVPTVTSPTWTALSSVGVTLGGNVTDTNGSALTQRGVVYSSSDATPTMEEDADFAVATGTTTGTFSKAVTGLTPGTKYYFRAYAKNGVTGYGYSAISEITTLTAAPTVTTGANVPSSTSASLSGNVTTANGAAITERGVLVSRFTVNTSPAIGGAGVTKVVHGVDAVGSYSVTASGLLSNTKYAYRAYAINSRGTSYGAVSTFNTTAGAPTVNTPTKTSITSSSAILGATVANANGAALTVRGVRVFQGATLVRNATVAIADGASGLGVFSVKVTGLTPATAYTFVAYATNSVGTGTAASTAFTTLAAKPSLGESSAALTSTGATLSGTVTDNNGAAISRYGVLYSISNSTPVLGGTGVLKSEVVGAPVVNVAFDRAVTSLKPGKKYYYRAYAVNGRGTGYSTVKTFNTPAAAPTVGSPTIGNVTTNSAILGGKVVSANGSAITERGIVYARTSIDSTPTLAEGRSKKIVLGTTGTFTTTVSGLTAGVKYSFRAYAKNGVDISYTNPVAFTTVSAAIPLAGALVSTASAGDTFYTTDAATGLKYLTIVVEKASGAAPVVEVSSNLTDWFSGSSHTTVISDDAGVLTVRDNTPATSGVKRYIRVKP